MTHEASVAPIYVASDVFSMPNPETKALADWLTDPSAGVFRADIAEGRERLLVWCRRWRDNADSYPRRYLIAHLLDFAAVDEAL